eukprot:7240855-Prymnesium_polylepis.1
MFHRVAGRESTPYTVLDGIERALEGLIVRHEEEGEAPCYYTLYASQPLSELCKVRGRGPQAVDRAKKQAVFADTARGIAGTGHLALPMGKYQGWLTGDPEQPKRNHQHTRWLRAGGPFGFRKPFLIGGRGGYFPPLIRHSL